MNTENHLAATLPPRSPLAARGAVWPARPPAPARTLLDVLDATARAHPRAPALDAGGIVLDYRGLLAAAGALAARLRRLGVGPGDRVGVRVPSGTADLYVAVLGALRAGAAYVPVDVDDPDERAALIWADAGVCAIVGESCGLSPGVVPATGSTGTPRPPAPQDDAWIIFTSGTTGRPKGVAVTHRSAAAFVDAEARLFLRDAPLGPGDRVLAGLSVSFDASCEEMWLAWRHGGCLVPAPRSLVRGGAELAPWLVRQGVTVVSTVPTLAALWPADALDRVRLLIVGGEACPAELVERLDSPGREFWNTYGPTETTVVACASLLRRGRPVRIGEPLDGWELAVVDGDGVPVAWGETGELLIAGVGTSRYLDPGKDAEKFRAHPALPGRRVYRSGDLVRADPDGLVFVGRADEQVKLGGRRIELGEIDAALAALPGVRAAAAAVRDTPAGGQVLVGYLVPEATGEGDGTSTAGHRPRVARRTPSGPGVLEAVAGPRRPGPAAGRAGVVRPTGRTVTGTGRLRAPASVPRPRGGRADQFTTVDGRTGALRVAEPTAAGVATLPAQPPAPGLAAEPGGMRPEAVLTGWRSWTGGGHGGAAPFGAPVLAAATSGVSAVAEVPRPVPEQRVGADGPGPSGPAAAPSGGGALDLAALRRLLLDRLPSALVPVLAVVPELPARTSGKVDRAALPWPLPGTGTGSESGAATETPARAGLTGTSAWLAEQWRDLLGVAADADSDFFALGGTSLAAARLVSTLRDRHPGLSVADLYHQPRLGDLALHLDAAAPRHAPDRQEPSAAPDSAAALPQGRWAGAYQAAVIVLLHGIGGLRWLLGLAAVDNLLCPLPWTPHTSWWLLGAAWLLLASSPGRAALGAASARLLTRGLRTGSYPRGGSAHLRLWTAERVVAMFNIGSVTGTPLARRYAMLLGCRVGRDVQLHSLPPVTGLATFGDGCALEPEVDVAGWWLDGGLLHIGAVRVGPGARVGSRSMLMPGASVGSGAEIAPGSCVTGRVPAGQRWHGAPARPDHGTPRPPWPPAPPRRPRHARLRRRTWAAVYALSLLALQGVPLLAMTPALVVLYALLGHDPSYSGVFDRLPGATAPLTLLTLLCYTALLAGLVRLFSRAVRPGLHPAQGRVAWSVWVVHQLMSAARGALFPLYSSLLTPAWLRLLGARVGRRVEASTVLALPGLTSVDDYAFLADDTLIAPYELRGGWLRLGRSQVGRLSFVGNSGIVGPGRSLPADSLVGVLSDAPEQARPGSSWLGRPGFPLQRVVESGERARTYDPPRRLVWARAGVELCRLLPVLLTALLGDLAAVALQYGFDHVGLLVCALTAGPLLLALGLTACLLTTAAKWLLLGPLGVGEHPLWSSFVWRNELFDTFVEELAMPWLGSTLLGTPFLNVWLRSLGASIGRGVWCESHWLPEPDLVRLGDGCTVNRGVVVQTHLFHDRLMRMDRIEVGDGASVGPHSVVLLGAVLGAGAAVGPSSLVMRGEALPAGGRWLGNPVAQWS